MTPFRLAVRFLLPLALAAAARPAAAAWTMPDAPLENHLRLGFRLRRLYLHDHTRTPDDSFRGSISRLRVRQPESPLAFLTAEWRFNRFLGLQLGWEQVRAQTFTFQNTPSLNHTDGDVSVFGPSLTALVRFPNRTRLTPFAGLGYAWLDAHFAHNPAWQNGFGGATREADYAAWRAAGAPPWPNEGIRRTITLRDCDAWLLVWGLEFRLTDQLDVCLFAQYADVDGADLTQRMTRTDTQLLELRHGTFPMSHTAYGAGVRWTF